MSFLTDVGDTLGGSSTTSTTKTINTPVNTGLSGAAIGGIVAVSVIVLSVAGYFIFRKKKGAKTA